MIPHCAILFVGPVWKVARYTTAAPMFFKECDNYVDGGVLANNPCDYGMTAIQNFYRHQEQKIPITVVVSVGTGVYPAEKLGNTEIFGRHGPRLDSLMKRAQNLISLLSNAVSFARCIHVLNSVSCSKEVIKMSLVQSSHNLCKYLGLWDRSYR